MPEAVVEITNKRGLHARASAKFVTCARNFDAKIDVTREGTNVPGTSIMGLMMLAASLGCSIKISADGADAEAALAELVALVQNGFGENDADESAQ
ncbi:MAG: HPr family phosphocarrier protein [Rhizobiales bacterium TMED249]|uniref:HPr family phosphocarrier protein n=1 Tax=PS1 clade bacterium TaxID=2175152 RepID=A0A368E025_9PROT|nr:MAG: HPr family phosphocarrier protein [Rhizobiales bacterium TMED249]RCL77468.1 MAG: HPr family phosphocarrier protein [PS1 clade bacterium]HAK98948.1 HPr family phosphocarrier protein [Rhodobiaceae bacterium]|tara:strand:- start:2290 stop:2577 length:288 start_codon:yes stop_codon:yes gene_type:complete